MIIAITDRKISAKRDFLEQIENIAGAGPDMIILREKDLSEAEYKYLAVECARICSYYNVKFCVNSFIKIAKLIDNRRVQLPFRSFVSHLEELNGFDEVWVSVHTMDEAADAAALGATHLIYGNVFETSCKPGVEGKGIEELKEICKKVPVPVFAVGGINSLNASKVYSAGCEGICVRSFLMQSNDPQRYVAELRIWSSRGLSIRGGEK